MAPLRTHDTMDTREATTLESLDLKPFTEAQDAWKAAPRFSAHHRPAVSGTMSRTTVNLPGSRRADKGVGTEKSPRKTHRDSQHSRQLNISVETLASSTSNSSFYNDDEFDDALECLDDEEEVDAILSSQSEAIPPPKPPLTAASSFSSDCVPSRGSSFSSVTTTSTAHTSVSSSSRTNSFHRPMTPDMRHTTGALTTPPTPESPSKTRKASANQFKPSDPGFTAPTPPKKRRTLGSTADPFMSSQSTSHPKPKPLLSTHVASVKRTNPIAKPPMVNDLPLRPFLVAHDPNVQVMMDMRGVSWAVQYEIARGVSKGSWTWGEVTGAKLDHLIGPSRNPADRVAKAMSGVTEIQRIAQDDNSLCELDREQAALMEDKGRGMGLQGLWKGVKAWYGGRVQQIARLELVPKPSSPFAERFTIRLEPLEQCKSNRFARFLGSRRLLQLRYPKDVGMKEGEQIRAFVERKLVICGRVFWPFLAKEHAVYLVETDSDYERLPSVCHGDHLRLSWDQFIKWHNSLELNSCQPISKWSARWQLGFSTSIPVLEFAHENIHYIEDEIATANRPTGKPRSEQIMTDGCGFINAAALIAIGQGVEAGKIPVAVQGRIGGSKGVWLLHPAIEHRTYGVKPRIWIRASQKKVDHGTGDPGRSQRIFDLVRLTRLTTPSGLNAQTIQNLAHNGVPNAVFSTLMETGLREEVATLMEWEGPFAMERLGKAIESIGSVVGSRLSRKVLFTARALGYVRDERSNDEDGRGLESGPQAGGYPSAVDRNPHSGNPTGLYEAALAMLHAGFTPQGSQLLRDKLRFIVNFAIDSYISKYHITIPLSAEAFIVPDPYGVLEEGQIYFRASEQIGDSAKSLDPHTFLGPVLVSRNPTMLPSDVQKVMAVHHEQLLAYTDVVVFSIKGKRSLASLLAGGDYDGDTVTVFADERLVTPFKNADFSAEPSNLSAEFVQEIESVPEFLTRTGSLPSDRRERELQKVLLQGLLSSKVGLYSMFHNKATYTMGYGHKDTVRLAYMFNTSLDSNKTGLQVKSDVFSKDQQQFGGDRPPCMVSLQDVDAMPSKSNMKLPERPAHLGTFILDILQSVGKLMKEALLTDYQIKCDELVVRRDHELMEPHLQCREIARKVQATTGQDVVGAELKLIEDHVEQIYAQYKSCLSATRSPKKQKSYKTATKMSEQNSRTRSEVVRELADEFHAKPAGLQSIHLFLLPIVKASYAYGFASKQFNGHTAMSFPFDMAHSDLCLIKSRSRGESMVPFTAAFADLMTLNGSLIRALSQAEDN